MKTTAAESAEAGTGRLSTDDTVDEARSRTRTLLAVFRSIVSRSAAAEPAAELFAMHLVGRIDSLARVHAKLNRGGRPEADLEELLADEIFAQAGPQSTVNLSGPDVRLPPKVAEALSLAFHELATNALKFGALAHQGAIDVRWTIEPDGASHALTIDWTETGVPALPVQPSARGFGLSFIEDALPYDIGVATEMRFAPGGLRCRIRTNLDAATTGRTN